MLGIVRSLSCSQGSSRSVVLCAFDDDGSSILSPPLLSIRQSCGNGRVSVALTDRSLSCFLGFSDVAFLRFFDFFLFFLFLPLSFRASEAYTNKAQGLRADEGPPLS